MPKGGLGLAPLEVSRDERHATLKSYDIRSQGNELQLRAYIFDAAQGVVYNDGQQITAADWKEEDLDMEEKRCVGKGASASVYYVEHKKTGQPLAVKIIPITTQVHRSEIAAELRLLSSSVNHPNILRHYTATWSPDTHCIHLIMEWMAYSLHDITRFVGHLDEEILRPIAFQLVQACRFLHSDEMKMIHRDIKPSNTLIGNQGQVKLGDFGISTCVKSLHQQQTDSYVGTQVFMAPERLVEGTYSYPADIWGLGLTLVSCATGKDPWISTQEGEEDSEAPRGGHAGLFLILERIATGTAPKLPERKFSDNARDFVAQCLVREPVNRATAEKLAEHPWIKTMTAEEAMGTVNDFVRTITQLMVRNGGGSMSVSSASNSFQK